MKRSTFSILFFIKRAKLLKNGLAPVYMRVTINGQSVEISLKRGILPRLWDTSRNKAKGNSSEALGLNDYLTSVRGQIFMHQKDLQETDKTITPKTLKNAFLGLGVKNWSIIELFKEHNKNMERLVGKDYAPLTFQRFETSLNHIKNFCEIQYNNVDLSLTEVNYKFITAFDFYLKTTCKCQHNSSMKHIKALKKIIRIGLANDYIRKDPFINYQITQKAVDRDFLTNEEIEKVLNMKSDIERIEIVRDLFIFQCYTGLSYKDLAKLSNNHIQVGIDGNKWIYIKRSKTGVPCRIANSTQTDHLIPI